MVSDVVLIHSTGQGAAGWERVVQALTRRGQTAHVVELPSDPDLLAADYAGLIRRHVGAVAAPIVLAPIVLAHSGAGPLLPAAARALQACHQVWLAAWVPDPEASFLEEIDRHPRAAFHPDWIGKDPIEDDAVAAAFLYHDCDEATLEWALSTRRLFLPLGIYGQRLSLAPEIPSTYIVAAHDRTIRPEWRREWRPRTPAPGLPAEMLIGVSASMVYGFAAASRHSEPTDLVFQVPRAGLTAKVHQRVNVRILELIDSASGSRIELEGNRLPLTHSKDVIDALGG